MKKASCCD